MESFLIISSVHTLTAVLADQPAWTSSGAASSRHLFGSAGLLRSQLLLHVLEPALQGCNASGIPLGSSRRAVQPGPEVAGGCCGVGGSSGQMRPAGVRLPPGCNRLRLCARSLMHDCPRGKGPVTAVATALEQGPCNIVEL